MKKVTKDEFYEFINQKDVKLKVTGKYPYTTYFIEDGEIVGYTENYEEKGMLKTNFYIKDENQ